MDLKENRKTPGVKGHYVALMGLLAGVFHIITNTQANSDMKSLNDNNQLVVKQVEFFSLTATIHNLHDGIYREFRHEKTFLCVERETKVYDLNTQR